ncbi:MAG TPA: DEAD/DEAH box helicase [Planctomycetota bacterium]|nr:DEAD/DEAH box helicase [Planctomycetota bacterium]
MRGPFDSFIASLQRSADYRDQIVCSREIPGRAARFARLDPPLHPELAAALEALGIRNFYTHQVQAVDEVRRGNDIVVVTGTASGKSLCYNISVLECLLAEPDSRALYVFPTKALAQDQLRGLERLVKANPRLAGIVRPGTYDGDTSSYHKRKVRSDANLVVTNPDMLHAGILPFHAKWARFFAGLRFVVLDEIHTYRGAFGSNVACVMCRLQRVCRHYATGGMGEMAPRFICCSATIANPRELAERLISRPVRVVDNDGSPSGRKTFAFWNPPHIDKVQMERRSSNVEAQEILVKLVRRGVQTIAFTKARVVAELIHRYAREELRESGGLGEGGSGGKSQKRDDESSPGSSFILHRSSLGMGGNENREQGTRNKEQGEGTENSHPITPSSHHPTLRLSDRISPYRGGYLPEERRDIEKRLFSGELLAVVSTNALELGIDVGGLDACIIVGYPGTIASTWQQAGRAGRGKADSLAVLVAYDDPIDQYLMRRPDYFFGKSPEHAVIDPENPYILLSHVACAAAELPLRRDETAVFGRKAPHIIDLLIEANRLKEIDGRFYWSCTDLPSRSTSLRTISDDTFTIIERNPGGNRVIGQVDSISAPELVYPEAVYLHEGESYQVRELDLEGKTALVERAELDYYTQPVLSQSLKIVEQLQHAEFNGCDVCFGDVTVTWATVMFNKFKFFTGENIGYKALDLPPQQLDTSATWVKPAPDAMRAVADSGLRPIEALIALRNMMAVALPVISMCDPRDVGANIETDPSDGRPAIFLYDRFRGGMGFAERGYECISEILAMARTMVESCTCAEGCPSCVGLPNLRPPIHQDPDVSGGWPIPSKQAAKILLREILRK